MNIQLLVTKNDFSLKNLELEFDGLGLKYDVEYIEQNPKLVAVHAIRHSPNIFIDGQLAFRRQPSISELKSYLDSIS